MATPVLPALAERHPGAAIDVLASAAAAPLLERNPHVARVIPLRRRNAPFIASPEKWTLVRALRAASYDLAIVLEHAPRYLDLIRRARPARIAGFHETRFDPALHSSANSLRAAGFDDWASRSLAPELYLDESDGCEVLEVLEGFRVPKVLEMPTLLVGLHAGYGPAGRKRNQDTRLRGWLLENFVDVGRALAARGLTVVLTGSREDRGAVRRIARELPAGSFIDIAGRLSVRGLAALITSMRVLVSVDSGPAHIAAAVGTPLVVLWGPGILEQTRPIGRTAPVTLLRHPPPCAPCYGTPLMKTCPRNVCMEAIPVDEVVTAAERLLTAEGRTQKTDVTS